MEKHKRALSLVGKTVTIVRGEYRGKIFKVQDYWDRLTGLSWIIARGNSTCLDYGRRVDKENLPMDNEVLFGHIGHRSLLMHVSDLIDEQEQLF